MIYDPFSDESRADPYPAYAVLRDHCPAFCNRQAAFWALSRHADVSAALKDWRTYSSAQGLARRGDLMDMDPPLHDRMRKLVAPRLRSTAVEPLAELARETAHRLLDRCAGPRIDLGREFVQRLPMLVMCRVLGFSEDECAGVAALGLRLVWAGAGADAAGARMHARGALAALLGAHVRERAGGRPTDDLLGDLARAVDDEAVTSPDVAGLGLLLLVAGAEPTASLLSNIVHALATGAVRRDQVLDAHGRVRPGAIAEFLRHDAPVQWVSRVATRAVPMHSDVIPAGQRVLLLIGAANRDPRRYDRADAFDGKRDAPQSLSFGLGVHACPGMPLARLQARVGLEVLLERLHRIRLAGPAVPSASHVLRGFDRLPVLVE